MHTACTMPTVPTNADTCSSGSPCMPAIRVLPGLDGTGRLSADFLNALHTCGIRDACALAYPVDRRMDYAMLESHARALLPQDRPFVLLAESFSGPIGLHIAAEPPPGLVGLVLSTTFARAPLPIFSPFAPWLRYAPARMPTRVLSPLLLGRWSTPALRSALGQALDDVAPDVLRHRAMLALRADVEDRLQKICLPTLVLLANQDRLMPARATAQLARQIVGARLHRTDGPHLLLQTRAGDCALAVVQFMADIGQTPM